MTLPLLASEQPSTITGHVCLDFSSPPEYLPLQTSGETGAPWSHKKHTAPAPQPKLHLRTMQVVFLQNIPKLDNQSGGTDQTNLDLGTSKTDSLRECVLSADTSVPHMLTTLFWDHQEDWRKWVPGDRWTACLAHLVSSRPVRGSVSKDKIETRTHTHATHTHTHARMHTCTRKQLFKCMLSTCSNTKLYHSWAST